MITKAPLRLLKGAFLFVMIAIARQNILTEENNNDKKIIKRYAKKQGK